MRCLHRRRGGTSGGARWDCSCHRLWLGRRRRRRMGRGSEGCRRWLVVGLWRMNVCGDSCGCPRVRRRDCRLVPFGLLCLVGGRLKCWQVSAVLNACYFSQDLILEEVRPPEYTVVFAGRSSRLLLRSTGRVLREYQGTGREGRSLAMAWTFSRAFA